MPKKFRIVHILVVCIIIASAAGYYLKSKTAASRIAPSKADVVGHLDGRPVKIPAQYANFVEFDQFEGRASVPGDKVGSIRGIKSFSFQLIDRSTFGDDEVNTQDIHSDPVPDALLVTARSNQEYVSDQELVHLVESAADRFGARYILKNERTFGLEEYRPHHPDALSNQNIARRLKTILVYRDQGGTVRVYIECDSELYPAPTCRIRYLLIPEMRVSVSVLIRRKDLPRWKTAQTIASNKIFSFLITN